MNMNSNIAREEIFRRTRALACFVAFGLILACRADETFAQEFRTLSFISTDAEFPNPERGFYRYRNLTNPADLDEVFADGQTLIYGRVDAREFRNGPLSDTFLDRIQAGFDAARENGLKVKFRLAYNNGFDEDAPKDVILNHIEQLQPLWEQNKDVMFHMDAGFIGAWGEWHGSTNGLENRTDRTDILFAILDALPEDRTVGIRTPHYKRQIFTGSLISASEVITEETAFNGSNLSRVGHLNDCFLSGPNDVGTYAYFSNNWPLERELDYIGQESLYVPFGGETCALHERGASENALAEMERLHIDYLNLDYHPDVIDRWKDEGTFDEIQRRLGYRFELKSGTASTEARPGGLLDLGFTIENVGFGELFNPRNVEVTIRNNETGEVVSTPLNVDARRWSGGETHEIRTSLAIPNSLPVGDYSIGLWMPDFEDSLRNDVRYAIRFANEGIWDAETGINSLSTSFVIDREAAGGIYDHSEGFAEVLDPSSLRLLGDFNGNGQLDGADIDLLRGDANLEEFDLVADGVVDSLDRNYWLDDLARSVPGDTDLNGEVNFADFLALSNSFGSEGGWSAGNFDDDNVVTFSDFLALSVNFGAGRASVASVPEPSCRSLTIGFAIVFLFRKTTRRRSICRAS